MKNKQKLFYSIIGFILGNIFLASMIFGVNNILPKLSLNNEVSLNEAIEKIKKNEIKEVHLRDHIADLISNSGEEFQTRISTEKSSDEILEACHQVSLYKPMKLTVDPKTANSFENIFQILFVLFLISPPLIVILLLIIIKKMDSKFHQ